MPWITSYEPEHDHPENPRFNGMKYVCTQKYVPPSNQQERDQETRESGEFFEKVRREYFERAIIVRSEGRHHLVIRLDKYCEKDRCVLSEYRTRLEAEVYRDHIIDTIIKGELMADRPEYFFHFREND